MAGAVLQFAGAGVGVRRGERFVGDEVVQRAPELRRDVLKRTDGRTYQARLDLADESLGELLAGKLRLAQTGIASRGAHPLAKRLTRIRHRRGARPH